MSTAAVEACYIIRYKLCERNKHQAQTTMLEAAPYCLREIFIQLGVEPLLRTGIEIRSTMKIRIKRIACHPEDSSFLFGSVGCRRLNQQSVNRRR